MENAARELQALQEGGVDGILIVNEFSLMKKVSYVTVAAMDGDCGRIKKEIKVPFCVNIVSNPFGDRFAAAVEADFEVHLRCLYSENGITDTNIPEVLRRKKHLD